MERVTPISQQYNTAAGTCRGTPNQVSQYEALPPGFGQCWDRKASRAQSTRTDLVEGGVSDENEFQNSKCMSNTRPVNIKTPVTPTRWPKNAWYSNPRESRKARPCGP